MPCRALFQGVRAVLRHGHGADGGRVVRRHDAVAAAALSNEGGGGVGALLEAVGFGEGGGCAFVGDRPFLLTDGDFDAGVGFEGGDEGLGLRLVERGVEAFVEGCRPDGLNE